MGAVSTTFMAGVELVRKGKAQPVGSLTQLGTIRLGKRTDNNSPKIKKFVPLADLDDLVFGGWDLFKDNAYQAASNAGVLSNEDLAKVKPFLSKIKPMKAAFDKEYVKSSTARTSRRQKTSTSLRCKSRKTSQISGRLPAPRASSPAGAPQPKCSSSRKRFTRRRRNLSKA